MNNTLFKSINKKFIFTIVTSSVFVTSLTITAVWFYLSSIDRLDIFFDAVSVNSSLGVIFFFILLSIMGFSILIFLPSFITLFIYILHEEKLKEFHTVPQKFSSICYVNSLFLCTIIITGNTIHFFTKINGYLIVMAISIAALIYSYRITINNLFYAKNFFGQHKSRIFNEPNNNEVEKLPDNKKLKFWLPLYLLVPGLFQMLPIAFFLPHLDFSEGTSNLVEFVFLIGFTFIIVTFGSLPGSIYLNEIKKNNKTVNILTSLMCMLAMLIALSFIYRPIPNMILNLTMSLSGINDVRAHSYYIETKTHPHSMFNNTLWNTRYYKDIPDRFFITGINVFSFGSIKLICPLNLYNIRKESLKLTINDTDEYQIKIQALQTAAMKCVPFDKNEIHAWDLPLPDPIYYEKVKLSTDNTLIKILHILK